MRADHGMVARLAALAWIALLAACAHTGVGKEAGSRSVRVMTYNIRLDLPSDGPNGWVHRAPNVAALVTRETPDIFGMQEVLVNQKRDLAAALPAYRMVGVGRDDGRNKGEFSPLAWRHERFDLVRSGTFWLSPTPEIPGKGWDAAYPRIATWAVLRERRSRRLLRVLNTHFDHAGEMARRNSAAMLAKWVSEGPDRALPTIVLGDFNADPSSEPYRRIAEDHAAGLRDARVISQTRPYGPAGTYTGFDITEAAASPIDHIFVTASIDVAAYAVITQHWGGRLPSDHYPVIADLRFRSR